MIDWKRVVLASGAGAAGVTVISIGLLAAITIAFQDWTPLPGASSETSLSQLLLFIVVLTTTLSIGGAIPARTLGVGWSKALLTSFLTHVVALLVFATLLAEEPITNPGPYLATPLTLAAAPTTLLAAHYGRNSMGGRGLAAVLAATVALISAAFIFSYSAVGIIIGILAWVLLPTIAAAFQGRDDENGSLQEPERPPSAGATRG